MTSDVASVDEVLRRLKSAIRVMADEERGREQRDGFSRGYEHGLLAACARVQHAIEVEMRRALIKQNELELAKQGW